MHARSGQLQVSAERIDSAVSTLTDEQLPRFREQPGYKGFTVLADRGAGVLLGISFWESEGDMKAAEDLASEARQAAREAGGGQGEPEVRRWEVLFDDMA